MYYRRLGILWRTEAYQDLNAGAVRRRSWNRPPIERVPIDTGDGRVVIYTAQQGSL